MSTVVVKLGGSALQNPETLGKLSELVHELRSQAYKPVIIHGGGPAINQELTQRGIAWQFINGQRQTTLEMISVIENVLANKINSMLTYSLQCAGLPAIGISGASNNLLFCTQASLELQQVGNIEKVNSEKIEALLSLASPQIPVIAPIGIGTKGEKYNINADCAAAKIAVALKAEKIIFLTDQKGILDHNSELVPVIVPAVIHQMINAGVINGGMYTKVMTMMMALNHGVKEVQVLHATQADEYGKIPLGTRLVESYAAGVILNKKFKEVTRWNRDQNNEMIHN